MRITEKLAHIEYLQVVKEDSQKVACGSNQEWFPTEWQRFAGCGPSTAANILFYINRKEDNSCCGKGKVDLLRFMEDTWQSVTPGADGIPSTALFLEKLGWYAARHGKKFHYFVLDVPPRGTERPSLPMVFAFISQGLRDDVPVAFLNLDHGAEKRLESWHWVTITAMDYSEDAGTAQISICDEEIVKKIDLTLWLETTESGGGFVYLLS
ncbi:MAG: hypothetical protein ACLUEQ_05050 [Cloacibacillus evryensis]